MRLAADVAACAPLLERALPWAVDGMASLAELGDAAVFEILDDGARVGAFALEVVTFGDGHRVRVLAAGGLPGYDLVGTMLQAVEREARERIGAVSMSCDTRRRGLVKRLLAEGFTRDGFNLRKAL